MENEDIKIIDTSSDLQDGQIKCPKCGSTDIEINTKSGKLRCNFCRYEFEPELAPEDQDISTLEGTTIGSGAADIDEAAEDMITVKCESCGAEVVIDTKTTTQARCHWCRNTLSINNKIPNGAIPDVILPFSVTKGDAQEEIAKFVRKRKFFAHPTFTREFTTENICGVYLPYMLVDVSSHMNLCGEGEIKTASYEVGVGDDKHTEYDADCFKIERDFDIFIDDLSIEASMDKLDYTSKEKTTNIINAIMPFDTENCVLERYGANYCTGLSNTMKKQFFTYDYVQEDPKRRKYDIIVGNPPYVEDFKSGLVLKKRYGNIFANVLMNAAKQLSTNGSFGFIIPLSYISTPRMAALRDELIKNIPEQYILSYSDRPDCLSFCIPDIIIYDEEKPVAVIDAKYKMSGRPDRSDSHQLLAYVLLTGANRCGFILPGQKTEVKEMVSSGDNYLPLAPHLLRYYELLLGSNSDSEELKKVLQ